MLRDKKKKKRDSKQIQGITQNQILAFSVRVASSDGLLTLHDPDKTAENFRIVQTRCEMGVKENKHTQKKKKHFIS